MDQPVKRWEGVVLTERVVTLLQSNPLAKEEPVDQSKDLTSLHKTIEDIGNTPGEDKAIALYGGNDNLIKLGYNKDKYQYIFEENEPYLTKEEAESHMVTISVKVWNLDNDGNKYASERNIVVNQKIGKAVRAVFDEIFYGEEQFPIKALTAFGWRSNSASEHNQGLAIDINPDENYMITKDKTVVAGRYWKPEEDPYSIREDGDVVKAFRRYGFSWGGNAWRSAHDYMHFSYFGN